MSGGAVMTEAPARHLPVMAGEVVSLLGSAPGHVLVDLTVGAGGHAEAFLRATAPTGMVIACDRDARALAIARERLAPFGSRARLMHGDWLECLHALATERASADAVLLDLGASSMQLDDPVRGFSLRHDANLDMRMDERGGMTAADFLNRASEADLAAALRDEGGEPAAARIARAIVERRGSRPLRTTGDLRTLVEAALGRKGGKIHPATRTFQAVRRVVNREGEQLAAALPRAFALLAPRGRLAVISFHSGEDGFVKQWMVGVAAGGGARLLTKRAVKPTAEECRRNRRSRSARLRAIEKANGGGA